jgi:3-oxoadipate enol-lactonase
VTRMSFIEVADCKIHYASSGAASAPVLLLSNSLGTTFSMWDGQVPTFEKHFRVLRYDTRGHGQSSVTPGSYSAEQLGKDVLSLLDALQIDSVYYCGLSMGGMIGMWLGTNAPERLHKLVLCNTAAKFGTAEGWNTRIETVRKGGMNSIATGVIERWFTPAFRASHPAEVAAVQRSLESINPEGYTANCAAVRDFDHRASLSNIRVPTLVIAGAQDPATPPSEGRFIAEHIPGARYVELSAAHLSNIEARDAFNREVSSFLLA